MVLVLYYLAYLLLYSLKCYKSNNIRGLGAVGAVVALAMLLLTGKSLFMLASMGCMLIVCYIAYKWGGVHLD